MNVYHVMGIRHCAVTFAETSEEAILKVIEQELIGDWENPQAIEVPLPEGFKIIS